jgi:hypothetical protein
MADGNVDQAALTAAVEAAVKAAEDEFADLPTAPLTEAWGSFVPAAPTEVAEADAVKAFDTELAGIFNRRTLKG